VVWLAVPLALWLGACGGEVEDAASDDVGEQASGLALTPNASALGECGAGTFLCSTDIPAARPTCSTPNVPLGTPVVGPELCDCESISGPAKVLVTCVSGFYCPNPGSTSVAETTMSSGSSSNAYVGKAPVSSLGFRDFVTADTPSTGWFLKSTFCDANGTPTGPTDDYYGYFAYELDFGATVTQHEAISWDPKVSGNPNRTCGYCVPLTKRQPDGLEDCGRMNAGGGVPGPQTPRPPSAAHPVSLEDGSLYTAFRCLSLGGNVPLDVGLRYDTALLAKGYGAPTVGPGWSVSYGRRLVPPRTSQDTYTVRGSSTSTAFRRELMLISEGGEQFPYVEDTANVFYPAGYTAASANSRINITSDTTGTLYRLTYRSGKVETYAASGYLKEIRDTFGNSLRFSLRAGTATSDGKLVELQRIEQWPSGATAAAGWVDLKFVQRTYTNKTTNPVSQVSAWKLEELLDSTSRGVKVTYNADGAVTSMVDELGYTRSFEFDALGYMTREWDPNNTPGAAGSQYFRTVYEPGLTVDRGAVSSLNAFATAPSGTKSPTNQFKGDKIIIAAGTVASGVPLFQAPARPALRKVVSQALVSTSTQQPRYTVRFDWATPVNGFDTRVDYVNASGTVEFRQWFAHGTAGRVTRKSILYPGTVTSPGLYTQYTLDATTGLITQETDPLNRSVTYELSADKRQVSAFVNGAGERFTLGYNCYGQQTQVTEPSGVVMNFTYDATLNATTGACTGTGKLLTAQRVSSDGLEQRTWTFSTNAQGKITGVTMPDGTVYTQTYDAAGYPDQKIGDSAFGGLYVVLEDLDHNSRGFVTRRVDRMGTVTAYTPNAKGWVTAQTQSNGAGAPVTWSLNTTFTHDKLGNITRRVDNPSGTGNLTAATDYVWDIAGTQAAYAMTRMTDPVGFRTDLTYGLHGEQTVKTLSGASVTSRTESTQYLYNCTDSNTTDGSDCNAAGTGYVKAVTTPPAPRTGRSLQVFNAAGQLVREKDARGVTTLYAYHATTGRLSSVTRGAVAVGSSPSISAAFTYGYDTAGRLTSISGPNNTSQAFGYDTNGRLSWSRTGNTTEGVRTVYTYDNRDRVTHVYTLTGGSGSSTAGAERVVQRNHDRVDRVTSEIVGPGGTNPQETKYSYTRASTAEADKWSLRNIDGPRTDFNDITRFTWHPLGMVATTRDASNNVYAYTYDILGHLTQHTAPGSRVVTYTPDALGRNTAVTHNGKTETWTFRGDGSKSTFTDFDGKTTRYCHDAAGRLVRIDRPDASRLLDTSCDGTANSADDARFTYDDADNLLTVTDYQVSSAGASSTYTYDALNRRATKTRANRTLTYTYNAASARTGLQYWTRGSLTFGRDSAGRIVSLTDWSSAVTSYTHRASGQPSGIQFPSGSGLTQAHAFDSADRLSGISWTKTGGTPWSNQLTYGYRDASNNEIAQMTRITQTGTGASTAGLNAMNGVTTFQYDSLNRVNQAAYPAITGGPGARNESFTIDPVGNRTSLTGTLFGYDIVDLITNNGFQHDNNRSVTANPGRRRTARIGDLESIDLSRMPGFNLNTSCHAVTVCPDAAGFCRYTSTEKLGWKGSYLTAIYGDGAVASPAARIRLEFNLGPDSTCPNTPYTFAAGDTLGLTFDGGKHTTVYLPAFTGGPGSLVLWVGDDGSTYYDAARTLLARQAAPL
jgi:YD repeat-containing protein